MKEKLFVNTTICLGILLKLSKQQIFSLGKVE